MPLDFVISAQAELAIYNAFAGLPGMVVLTVLTFGVVWRLTGQE